MSVQYVFSRFPELYFNNIVLREIKKSDAQAYFEYMNDQAMDGFLTQENRPRNFREAQKEVEYWRELFVNKISIYWAISLKNTNKMIGTAGFNVISFLHSQAEISYDLNPTYWGQGIMLNSMNKILDFAKITLELMYIQSKVVIGNTRSTKLLERVGFIKKGVLSNYKIIDGQYKDYYIYSKIIK